jgi:lactoylglutathione lyase
MKKYLIISIMFLSIIAMTTNLFAQDITPHADHVALYVRDMDKSVAFYEKVMLFKPLADPFHNEQYVVWLRTGEHTQLHLIQGAKDVPQRDINIHYAYAVGDLQAFMKHLDDLHIKYGNWGGEKIFQTRPDGVKQIYLQDPDNYWIEVDDDKF